MIRERDFKVHIARPINCNDLISTVIQATDKSQRKRAKNTVSTELFETPNQLNY